MRFDKGTDLHVIDTNQKNKLNSNFFTVTYSTVVELQHPRLFCFSMTNFSFAQ
jgi:hypothetical protein